MTDAGEPAIAEELAAELVPPGGGGALARVVWERREGVPPSWAFDGDPAWDALEAVRVVGAELEDGTLVAIAAARPAGTEGHAADAVAGVVLDPEEGVAPAHEVLLSTEYGPDGSPRRLGAELYEDEESPPRRLAADVEEITPGEGGLTARLAVRMNGLAGEGTLDVVRRG